MEQGRVHEKGTGWALLSCPVHGSYRVRCVIRDWEDGTRTYSFEFAKVEGRWTDAERDAVAARAWRDMLNLIAEHDETHAGGTTH